MDGESSQVDTPRPKVISDSLQIIMSLLIPNSGITSGITLRCLRSIYSFGRSCMEEYSQERIWKKEGSLAHLDVLYVLGLLKLSVTCSYNALMLFQFKMLY